MEAPRNSLDNYKVPTSAHGLRHLFSTLLNEFMTLPNDLIESCLSLSHSPKDIISTTCNKANLVMPMREVFKNTLIILISAKLKKIIVNGLKIMGLSCLIVNYRQMPH